jgi:hypothetical protein
MPQLAMSLPRSTQAVPQAVRPMEHVVRQRPEEQTWPAVQATLQAPQWAALVAVSTQAAPQRAVSRG